MRPTLIHYVDQSLEISRFVGSSISNGQIHRDPGPLTLAMALSVNSSGQHVLFFPKLHILALARTLNSGSPMAPSGFLPRPRCLIHKRNHPIQQRTDLPKGRKIKSPLIACKHFSLALTFCMPTWILAL